MPSPLLIFSQSDYLVQVVDTGSNTEWQTVKIQISWLLQNPTDLDLHCLQKEGTSGFSRTRVKLWPLFSVQYLIYIDISRARDKRGIQVKYPSVLSKYSIIFKNLGIETKLIWQSIQLFPNSRVEIKVLRPEKHTITILYHDYCT